MRKLVLLICLIGAINMIQAQNKNQRKYAVKSGYIEYELTGNTKGTKKYWWDNFGYRTRTEVKSSTTTKVFGMTSTDEEHTISIIDGTNIYSWDLIKKTGQKSVNNEQIQMSYEMTENMTEAEQKKLADEILETLGGERLGSETVLGKTCEVISVLGAKSWIYKGLPLKSEAKVLMIKNYEIAKKIDENIKIPESTFEPDKSIEYQDISQLQNQAIAGYGNLGDMNDDESDTDNDDENYVQVKYPYSNFQSVINNFKYKKYRRTILTSQDGQHQAMFNTLISTIAIVATSTKNTDTEMAGSGFNEFTHNGKTCRFGRVEGGIASSLIVEYPKYDMYIVIVGRPVMSKEELLSISDMLNF